MISGTASALRSWLLTSVPTPICLCKPLSCKACPGINYSGPIVEYTNLSNPKPEHTTGASGQGARRGGGAGPGRTGRRQNSSPRRQASLAPPKASKKRFPNVSPEARTSKILCKPNAGTKSPVDKRFVSDLSPGRETLFVPGCRPVGRRLFVSVNPFHARHVREHIKCTPTCRTQNPDIPRAGRDGLVHGGRRGGAGQDGTPTDRSTKETSVLHTFKPFEDNPPGFAPGSKKLYVNRWRNKISV